MARFHYQAYAATGRTISGVIDADTRGAALSLLQQRGVRAFKVEERATANESPTPWWQKQLGAGLPLAERARSTRQLATLVGAGVALDRALGIMAMQSKPGFARATFEALLAQVSGGHSLSSAMAQGPFKPDEWGLVRAGEQTGALATVLAELASLLERRTELRGKLLSALVYPAFLLVLAPSALLLISLVVVPNLAPIFESSGAPMPLVLQIMMLVGTALLEHPVLALAAALVPTMFGVWFFASSQRRARLATSVKSWPGIRTLANRADASRLCRTLGSLLQGGAALQTALAATAETLSDTAARSSLVQARDAVSRGVPLAKALQSVTALDATQRQMIAIGEETNRLVPMLLYVADSEETSLTAAIDRAMALLTPLLTVIIGIMVGGIVMSIMRAILSVNDLAAP